MYFRILTFFQRKNGLFKKAYELGVLCSVDVAVIVFDNKQGGPRLYQYGSDDVITIVERAMRVCPTSRFLHSISVELFSSRVIGTLKDPAISTLVLSKIMRKKTRRTKTMPQRAHPRSEQSLVPSNRRPLPNLDRRRSPLPSPLPPTNAPAWTRLISPQTQRRPTLPPLCPSLQPSSIRRFSLFSLKPFSPTSLRPTRSSYHSPYTAWSNNNRFRPSPTPPS